ncbi:MAG: hypothetical protein BWY11_01555 [Firmicutes bacterium ADurb.Bin182]|nr:MAG: hypothetical protein BWY11_01555 [Firmicutes bacterium ADurb.Bin182]
MPIFERGVDSKTAYAELINYEKKIYTSIPGGVIMNNYRFVIMCIQAGDYEKAFQHMLAIVKQNEESFRINVAEYEKKGDIKEFNFYVENSTPELQRLKDELHRLSIPDVEYFQNLVAQNTAISLEYLKNPRKSK